MSALSAQQTGQIKITRTVDMFNCDVLSLHPVCTVSWSHSGKYLLQNSCQLGRYV